MRQPKLTANDYVNMWLEPIYGTTIEKEFEKDPWESARDFYQRFPVTQKQHDEWEKTAKAACKKDTGYPKKMIERSFWSVYLNSAPNIKND